MSLFKIIQNRETFTKLHPNNKDLFSSLSFHNEQALTAEIPQQQLSVDMILLIVFGIVSLLSLIIYIKKKSNLPEKIKFQQKR